MKTYLKLFIVLIVLVHCKPKGTIQYFDTRYKIVNAKFYKIEEKSKNYVFHFKHNGTDGVFVQSKFCGFQNKSWKKIKLNKNYKLLLVPMQISSRRASGFSINIDGDYEWDSDMNSTYYKYCGNICGNKIYEMKWECSPVFLQQINTEDIIFTKSI